MGGRVLAESLHLVMDQWIQYKLGKQYLLKKITLPWESNPGPTPIRGDPATLVASVGLKNANYHICHNLRCFVANDIFVAKYAL